jgi:hypothetical protein
MTYQWVARSSGIAQIEPAKRGQASQIGVETTLTVHGVAPLIVELRLKVSVRTTKGLPLPSSDGHYCPV